MLRIHEHYLLITLLDRLHNGQRRQHVHPMYAIKKFCQSTHHAGNEKCMYTLYVHYVVHVHHVDT